MNFKEFLNEGALKINVPLFDVSAVSAEVNKYYKKMYNVKLGKVTSNTKGLPKSLSYDAEGQQVAQGTKEALVAFLTGDEPYAFDLDTVEDAYPELS